MTPYMLEWSLGHLADNAVIFVIIAAYYSIISKFIKKKLPNKWAFIFTFIAIYFVLFHFFHFDLFVVVGNITVTIIHAFFNEVISEETVAQIFFTPIFLYFVFYMSKWTFFEIIKLKELLANRFNRKISQKDINISTMGTPQDNKSKLSEKSEMPMRLLMVAIVMIVFYYIF